MKEALERIANFDIDEKIAERNKLLKANPKLGTYWVQDAFTELVQMAQESLKELGPATTYPEDSDMYTKGYENGKIATHSDALHAAEVANAKREADAYTKGWKNGHLDKDPLSQNYKAPKGSIEWLAIEHMHEHVHGLYLCLIENSDDASEPHHVEERYFTYNSKHESTFQNAREAKGVVAFLVPRFYSSGSDTRVKDLQRDNKHLRRQLKDLRSKQ